MKALLFGIGTGLGFFGGCLALVASLDLIFGDTDFGLEA